MKRFLLPITCILLSVKVLAVPAYPLSQTMVQPDGTTITFVLHGDERSNYITTEDGYLLHVDADGFMRPTLDGQGRMMRPQVKQFSPDNGIEPTINYDSFRGLVVLANYNNWKFIADDPLALYSEMINGVDYRGFTDQAGQWQECTGSLRDYFADNSFGRFVPEFDVVGPVEIDYSYNYVDQSKHGAEIVGAALAAADDQVDFTRYDSNGDGKVDMVYVIFPGYGSNYTGKKELWAFASDEEIPGLVLDGLTINRYACSTELYGIQGNPEVPQILGIGTICHEFSHLLGFVDEYDTNYQLDGMSDHPNFWSLMSMGCYNNMSRSPIGMSLFQRMVAKFVTPAELTEAGNYTLDALETSGEGFIFQSINPGEFYLLENRQPTKWDATLPGFGMLAYRVNENDPDLWLANGVNAFGDDPHYLLLRAMPQLTPGGRDANIADSEYDPFPGLGNVTELTNTSSTSLQTANHLKSNITLHNIAMGEDGTITFDAEARRQTITEEVWDDAIEVADNTLEGSVATWTLAGASLDVLDDAMCLSLIKSASVTSSAIHSAVNMVHFDIVNNTRSSVTLQLKYSVDGGRKWVIMPDIHLNQRVIVPSGSGIEEYFDFDAVEVGADGLMLQIKSISGLTDQGCSVGNITFYNWDDKPSDSVADIATDSRAADAPYEVFDIMGRKLMQADSADCVDALPAGLYIVRHGNSSTKISVQ